MFLTTWSFESRNVIKDLTLATLYSSTTGRTGRDNFVRLLWMAIFVKLFGTPSHFLTYLLMHMVCGWCYVPLLPRWSMQPQAMSGQMIRGRGIRSYYKHQSLSFPGKPNLSIDSRPSLICLDVSMTLLCLSSPRCTGDQDSSQVVLGWSESLHHWAWSGNQLVSHFWEPDSSLRKIITCLLQLRNLLNEIDFSDFFS